MTTNSHWLVIDVVSMMISHIAQAPHPASPTIPVAYLKWDKELIRIINKYFSAVSYDTDPGKLLSTINN